MSNDDLLNQAAAALAGAHCGVAVTGAGISVESGIPDFRSQDGLWSRYPVEEYATIEAFWDDPDKVWEMFYELGETFAAIQPNAGHYALAELEALGRICGVVTQNIDNLHTAAGSGTVIEYHGSAREIVCPACARRRKFSLDQRMGGAPRCECGGVMKPDLVLFGEAIPARALIEAERLAGQCDVMLVVGTSAAVYPAAMLPPMARQHGAVVIECNIEATDFTNSVTDIFLHGPAAQILPEVVRLARVFLNR